MRGTCGHDLGVIGPGSYEAGAAKLDGSGFLPLKTKRETTAHGQKRIPEMETTITTFAVKNGRYHQTSQKVSTGVCHHCARWTCHAP